MLIFIRKASPDFRNTKLLLSLSCEQISISATARPTELRETSRLEKRAKPKGGGGGKDWGLEGRRKGSHFVPTCFARQLISNGFAAGVEAFLREPGHCVCKV